MWTSLKIGAPERIRELCDINSFDEFDAEITTFNEENFYQYDEKLEKAKANSGINEAVVCGIGEISGKKVVICAMDSNFMMGSMGKVVGEKITRSIEYATLKKITFNHSNCKWWCQNARGNYFFNANGKDEFGFEKT